MITFTQTNFGQGINRCCYKAGVLFATISHAKPTRSNGRQAPWNVCRMTGRVDWFDTLRDARDDALKG